MNLFEDIYMSLWMLMLWAFSAGFSIYLIADGAINNSYELVIGSFLFAFLMAGMIIACSSRYNFSFTWT